MLVLILTLFFHCNLGFAVSEEESVALEDSTQVFSDFNASAQHCSPKILIL